MGAFEFVALDKAGKESKGLLEGDTAKHVRQILRERQLLPVNKFFQTGHRRALQRIALLFGFRLGQRPEDDQLASGFARVSRPVVGRHNPIADRTSPGDTSFRTPAFLYLLRCFRRPCGFGHSRALLIGGQGHFL